MLPPWQSLLILAPVAYLLGSTAIWVIGRPLAQASTRARRAAGISGATNVGRLLGKRYFAMVLALDMLKGLFPMLAGGLLLRGQPLDRTAYLLWLLVGFAAITGHMFSIFLRFKGGKGVATEHRSHAGSFSLLHAWRRLVAVPDISHRLQDHAVCQRRFHCRRHEFSAGVCRDRPAEGLADLTGAQLAAADFCVHRGSADSDQASRNIARRRHWRRTHRAAEGAGAGECLVNGGSHE